MCICMYILLEQIPFEQTPSFFCVAESDSLFRFFCLEPDSLSLSLFPPSTSFSHSHDRKNCSFTTLIPCEAHCQTPQHTATHRNTPQHTVATLQHTVYCNTQSAPSASLPCRGLQTTLQHTASRCNNTATHSLRPVLHTLVAANNIATHRNILQQHCKTQSASSAPLHCRCLPPRYTRHEQPGRRGGME